MSKQKIVIKAALHCDKCRSKALSTVASADGVTSVAIQGNDKDEIVVIGEGVDSIELVKTLRKKVGYATLVSVQPVPPPAPPPVPADPPICGFPPWCPMQHPQFQIGQVVGDPYPNHNNCSIM